MVVDDVFGGGDDGIEDGEDEVEDEFEHESSFPLEFVLFDCTIVDGRELSRPLIRFIIRLYNLFF